MLAARAAGQARVRFVVDHVGENAIVRLDIELLYGLIVRHAKTPLLMQNAKSHKLSMPGEAAA
jgi:hypothetical protein